MTKHLDRDMDRLHRDILSLCAMVEEMIGKAVLSLCEGRLDLADEVAKSDRFVNEQEVRIEDECLKMLALHHPVAVDLRRIATTVKVNNDLERIADLAVNITERAVGVREFTEFVIPDGVEPMAKLVIRMIRNALDSFVHLDTVTARVVIAMDDDVDDLNAQLIAKLRYTMQHRSDLVTPSLHCFSAIRHLERIADLATNIAEDAIYLVDGEIVRHGGIQLAPPKTVGN
ncbi:MAG: phosphate signaling complex protein PhoU [Pirellulaceae bacterium]